MPASDRDGWLRRAGLALLPAVLSLLARTWRVRQLGREHLEPFIAARRPVVLVFWHDHALSLAADWLRRLDEGGYRISVLASRSRDGALVARLGEAWGVDIVRGSSSRGGKAAILALARRLRKAGTSPALAPDGPRGPRHEFKPGALALAQLSGAPIVPLAAAARSAWTLRSWDRQTIPRPFTRVTIAIGASQPIARDLTGEALDGERQRLERLLAELGDLARANS